MPRRSPIGVLHDRAVRFLRASDRETATEDQARDLAKLASDVVFEIDPNIREIEQHHPVRRFIGRFRMDPETATLLRLREDAVRFMQLSNAHGVSELDARGFAVDVLAATYALEPALSENTYQRPMTRVRRPATRARRRQRRSARDVMSFGDAFRMAESFEVYDSHKDKNFIVEREPQSGFYYVIGLPTDRTYARSKNATAAHVLADHWNQLQRGSRR